MKLKDKKIDILKSVVTVDAIGNHKTTLKTLYPSVWAYFRYLSGNEVFTGVQTKTNEEVLFQIGYKPDVDTTCTIRYNGKEYNITRIDAFEGYKADLKLYAKKK